jgi:thiol:disulfide interchange protein DsbD
MIRAALRGAIALLLSLAAASAGAAPDVLRPEKAFRYEATTEGDAVLVRWSIEPGHYLYRERMGFASRTPGVTLGPAVLPEGEPYHDEFFGDMHIYRNAALVRIPVTARGGGSLDLEIRSQGCADIGLCYPPQIWTTQVSLPAARPARAAGELAGLLAAPGPGAPLPAEKAFRVSATLVAPDRLEVRWDIAEGYYLYRDSLKVENAAAGPALGTLALPPGEPMEDEYFGRTEVFREQAVGTLAVGSGADPLQLRISHQGCKQDSICYPPQTLLLTVAATPAARPPPAPVVSEQDQLAGLIGSGNLAFVMLTFAGFGLLLSFTPCCLPMIPILSGIIVGQGERATAARGFALSLTYVLGMAVTYTAAGAAFAAAGQQIQAALQQTWIIVAVAALFVALALAMFGAYEIQLPAAIMNRINAASGRQKTGTFLGTAAMGALSALVVTTCVAPPLVAALTVIARTGDVVRGALALFALSIGMGLPLLAIGASAGRLLPKAGAWMNSVKGAFGFMMLGLAVWMLDRILPDLVSMFLWAALAVMAAAYLGAFQRLGPAATPAARLAQGAGLIAAVYGAALLVGALGGSTDPLRPLDGWRPAAAATESSGLAFRRVKTVAELDAAVAAAAAGGKPVMFDFYADWCASCIEMERYTFRSPEVRAALDGAVLLQADVTANDESDRALLERFGIFGPPTIVFFGADGREREGYRVVGFKDAAEFSRHVRDALGS